MDTIISRFNKTAEKYADFPALISDTETLTYEQFRIEIEKLAEAINAWYHDNLKRSISNIDTIGVFGAKSTRVCSRFTPSH